MTPVIRMFVLLAAAGLLSALAFRMPHPILVYGMLAAGMFCWIAGIYNFYLHARTRWPFRRD